MTEDLFTVDRSRVLLIPAADPTRYLGALESPAQACRAVFLAGQVGAIGWDREAWPELAYGVWSDAVTPQGAGRRHQLTSTSEPAELSTWLHLHPSWPQLGGSSVPWPPAGFGYGFDDLLGQLIAATVDALNATFRAALWMSEALATAAPGPSVTTPLVIAPFMAAPSVNGQVTNDTGPDNGLVPIVTPAEHTTTFTATRVATTDAQVGMVLAALVHDAEHNASAIDDSGHRGFVTQVSHTVTALSGFGDSGFLVTLTATIESVRDHH